MKSTSQLISFTTITILVLLLLVPSSNATLTCSAVVKYLTPCAAYVQSGSGKPPPACCSGASSLASAASTPADKEAVCNCLKTIAKSSSFNLKLAAALPKNCGIKLSIPISTSVDCSKI
ncbi:hypothetical protein LguiB_011153 [Lonicera macranthoides]